MAFRKLRADEIDCRVATVNGNGCSLLLYKDARVDQNILDETFGMFGWQRKHEVIDGRLYCTVDVWDGEKQRWVSKQDVGTESYTEKEKGQASDSFKRACFNWGIGRELYTAPFIWVSPGRVDIAEKNGKYTTYTKFRVDQIGYDSAGNIDQLVISSYVNKSWDVAYTLGKPVPDGKDTQPVQQSAEQITLDARIRTLGLRCQNDGVDPKRICELYKVSSLSELDERKLKNIEEHWKEIKG